jgi:hypothetical protein
MIKKISFLTIAFFLVVLNISAEEKTMVFGGKTGWHHISRTDRIVSGKGRFGYDALTLATNSRPMDSATDILLNFEDAKIQDESKKYSVTGNSLIPFESSLMGKYSGLARGNGGLRLRGNEKSLFGKSGQTGSFVIEFWLNPSIAENGEIVFSWRSSRTVSNYPLYQMITASFSGNHLEWSFVNVFNGYVENRGEITLSSYRTIIPETWLHHSIRFDEDSGLLEYRINGLLEAQKYVTETGHEDGGSIYVPTFGVPADIDICPQFTGLVDDFRIERSSKTEISEKLRFDTYPVEGGRFETEPILLSNGAKITRLDALVSSPSQTDVEFFVRSGDNFYNWTDEYPAWIPVKNHQEIDNVSGLYFQVAANLFPDGSGKKSPSVTEMKISYKEIDAPLAPFKLSVIPSDGEVTLTWPYSVDESVGGYYIFYGERPGEYLGRDAYEGTSPIDVGSATSVTLTGLKNGKIYYFAVSSYSKYDSRITGELSNEVFARPLKK